MLCTELYRTENTIFEAILDINFYKVFFAYGCVVKVGTKPPGVVRLCNGQMI